MSSWADNRSYLRSLSFRKAWNMWRIWSSYKMSKARGKSNHRGMPVSLAIEPTTSCNLRCPECPSGLRSFTRPTGMLSVDLYKKVIDELSPNLTYLTLYFQGEPYLHQDFHSLIRYASSKRIYTATSTNAHYLTPEVAEETVKSGLDRLIISIDGSTQETYESYRVGGKLDKVLEGTKNVIEAKKRLKSKTPHVIFQFLVVKPNEHQIGEVQRLASDLGVDEVRLKTAQIYDHENGSDLIPEQDKYSRYRLGADGKWKLKNKMSNSCWRMWKSAVMTWDGKVIPCCFDKDAHHSMGSVASKNFKHIWKSQPYQQFRSQILKSRSEIEMCKNCTEGTKVFA